MLKYVYFILFGIISGVLGGMGMGGGTLLIPLLTLIMDAPQHQAQLYNLVAFIPMAAVSLFIHAKNGFIEKKGLPFAVIPAALFAVGGSFLATVVEGDILKRVFGGFLLLMAIVSFIGQIKRNKRNKN